jgi:urease accessory protein
LFAGDRLEQRVRVERGARVLLVSQSALQVHPAAAPAPASLDSSYDVETDATLDCFWDPLIPFAGARLRQQTDVRIAAGGQLFWSDALMSGRASRGEAWRFDSLDHELRVSVDGSLIYLERYALAPESRQLRHSWRAGAASYLGTTIVQSDTADAARAEAAQQQLNAIDDVRAGVDYLAPQLVVGRVLATRGPQFASARTVLRDVFARPPLRGK